MGYLVGIGSGAYGAVIGGIFYYFVTRMTKYDAEALRAVVVLVGGAAVLYFIQQLGFSDPATKSIAFSSYPIGLLWVGHAGTSKVGCRSEALISDSVCQRHNRPSDCLVNRHLES